MELGASMLRVSSFSLVVQGLLQGNRGYLLITALSMQGRVSLLRWAEGSQRVSLHNLTRAGLSKKISTPLETRNKTLPHSQPSPFSVYSHSGNQKRRPQLQQKQEEWSTYPSGGAIKRSSGICLNVVPILQECSWRPSRSCRTLQLPASYH